ncbi:MAG: nickel pincer cofactor biosynthesis protein LarC [Pyrinomonadaceae bacterium]
MRTLYFDCFAGASGDMILGGLIGLGVEPDALESALRAIKPAGWELRFSTVDRSGIAASRVEVLTEEVKAHRHLRHILDIISDSMLSTSVKVRAAMIFTRLAEAESKVHQVPIEKIHFHEVGALDAIVDIVGACIGFEMLGIERFCASPLHVGSGFVDMAHGRFPVPPPAVTELLAGAPIYATDIVGELVTPTGAAIISTLAESYGPIPAMTVSATGYGAGGRSYEKFPNAIRLIVGDTAGANSVNTDQLIMLETNLDDLAPQTMGYVMEQLLAGGALDSFFTAVQMKKNRPGVMISVLCDRVTRPALERILFRETTTLGIRVRKVERVSLRRAIVTVVTEYGHIDVKVAQITEGETKASAEYEQCRAAAILHGVSLRDVEAAAVVAYRETQRTTGG